MERIVGGFFVAVGAVGTSSMLKQCERFSWIVDHDFVIAEEIVTDDAVEFRTDRGVQHGEEIRNNHRHSVDLSTPAPKGLQRSRRKIDRGTARCSGAYRRSLNAELLCQLGRNRARRCASVDCKLERSA